MFFSLLSHEIDGQSDRLYGILPIATARDDAVQPKITKPELPAATVAPASLLTEQAASSLTGRPKNIDVGAHGDVGAGGDEPVYEQLADVLLQAHIGQFDSLARDVYADPPAAWDLGAGLAQRRRAGGVEVEKRGSR